MKNIANSRKSKIFSFEIDYVTGGRSIFPGRQFFLRDISRTRRREHGINHGSVAQTSEMPASRNTEPIGLKASPLDEMVPTGPRRPTVRLR